MAAALKSTESAAARKEILAFLGQAAAASGDYLHLDLGRSLPAHFPKGDDALALDTFLRTDNLKIATPEESYWVTADTNPFEVREKPGLEKLSGYLLPASMFGQLPANRQARGTVLAHELLHIAQCQAHNLDSLLGLKDHDTIGSSSRYGLGPDLERIIADDETPAETAARHKKIWRLAKKDEAGAGNRRELEIYDLQYGEVQARVAQLIHASAPHWKNRPDTPEKLREAFYGPLVKGVDHPDYPLATAGDPGAYTALYELKNGTMTRLTPRQRERFFDEALPAIVGDLYEFQGHADGRTKMGLDASPLHARIFLQQAIHEAASKGIDLGLSQWSAQEWRARGARVEPEHVPRLRAVTEYLKLDDARQALAPSAALQSPVGRRPALDNIPYQRVPAGVLAAQNLDRSAAVRAG